MLESIDPATGTLIQRYPTLSERELVARIEASERAFVSFRSVTIATRATATRELGKLLLERKETYARTMTLEMGKPIRQARGEVEKCATLCDYFADHAERMLEPERVVTEASQSYVSYRPLGPILAIMPWNFPFWQVFRFAVPALIGGNTVLLKHAPNVCGSALTLEEMFQAAGFPEATFQTLLVDEAQAQRTLAHPAVRAVTCTGSPRAGSAVGEHAGKLLKPSVLELGGSDPYLVLDDADLELAAKTCAQSRLINGGQSCIAAKRFIVVKSRRAEFESAFLEQLGRAKVGNPLDEATDLGPLARLDLREGLGRQVSQSVERGAKIALGCVVPAGPGAFYPVSLLTDVSPGMPAYEEELFGPVASLIQAEDEAHAIRIANDSSYGLGAAVFTRDVERGRRIADELLEAGSCFVNAFVRSDPRLPFGGIKQSGYGRELGVIGLRAFLNAKTIYVA